MNMVRSRAAARPSGSPGCRLPHGAFLRHDKVEVVVLGHDLRDVAVVLHDDIDLARGSRSWPLSSWNDLTLCFCLISRASACLISSGAVVDGLAEIFEAERMSSLASDITAMRPLYCRSRTALPAVEDPFDLGLAIADADDEPSIGHGEFAARIEGRVLEEPRDILHVGDLGVIERLSSLAWIMRSTYSWSERSRRSRGCRPSAWRTVRRCRRRDPY